jgi:hypothetical protein
MTKTKTKQKLQNYTVVGLYSRSDAVVRCFIACVQADNPGDAGYIACSHYDGKKCNETEDGGEVLAVFEGFLMSGVHPFKFRCSQDAGDMKPIEEGKLKSVIESIAK